jgi:hypothetical protein
MRSWRLIAAERRRASIGEVAGRSYRLELLPPGRRLRSVDLRPDHLERIQLGQATQPNATWFSQRLLAPLGFSLGAVAYPTAAATSPILYFAGVWKEPSPLPRKI